MCSSTMLSRASLVRIWPDRRARDWTWSGCSKPVGHPKGGIIVCGIVTFHPATPPGPMKVLTVILMHEEGQYLTIILMHEGGELLMSRHAT